ncbi:hypothetical protein LTR70_002905 [Exophiala xenobiotica]|uniref:Uncharacterized protein n=1 Tax=Lithohypha guttulata TaxID=1690604 RepID=A0ABR0KHN0_9EURO|nr:hypothetical protein LTR24_002487 [Lithohypha guttulata]KAK5324458.1 hypothetical protein LTR70_002905 [Exophiala xenobiotica]
MRLPTVVATVVASSTLAFAETGPWDNWAPDQPVTTITKVLLHANETMTMTSYSSTTAASSIIATVTTNVTTSAYSKPASATFAPLASSTTAPIATFSTGAATALGLDGIAALAGIGAVVYGLF